ncbi:MAG: homoserine kinase [Anaerolineales bacterium]|nr:homoserine kinase [Anaerolineales bacterium]MBX3038374.1 homoserine kinase [Anaerolineales bacterium]
MIKIRVPATSANLGPGFDCLGMALDIWNEITFEPADKMSHFVVGEGEEKLNKGIRNLLTKSFAKVHQVRGKKLSVVKISAQNKIFMSSGLGSSAAAIVAGLFAANEILSKSLSENDLLKLATDMEGHPDNVAPALFGGLIVSVMAKDEILWRRYETPDWTIVIVKPQVEWLTKTARAVLPKSISRTDAIFNIGRTSLVIDALRSGDLSLLQKVMDDRIHQPYRLKHISGGMAAYKVAKQFGAAALSGAGPSIISFVNSGDEETARNEIANVFEERGIETKSVITKPSSLGVHLI